MSGAAKAERQGRVPIGGARRRAPRQPADCPGGRAARPRVPSSPSIAAGQHACGRPRGGSVAAVLPHWSHGDRRLPDGRLKRPLPPPVKGHGRDAWCEYWSGLAGGRWELNGSRVYPGRPTGIAFGSARARADTALANSEADRRALPARPGEARPPSTALPRARDAELEAVIVGVAVRPVRGVGTGRAPDRAENTTLYTWRFFSLPRGPEFRKPENRLLVTNHHLPTSILTRCRVYERAISSVGRAPDELRVSDRVREVRGASTPGGSNEKDGKKKEKILSLHGK